MNPRLVMITLGVSDMGRAVRFYRDGLGFQTDIKPGTEDEAPVAFFPTGASVLGLFPFEQLAEDMTVPYQPVPQYRGVSCAWNVDEKEQVQQVLDRAADAGATVVKTAQDVFWGGFHGYFADPDGHMWEVAWHADFKYDGDGRMVLGE